MKKVTQYLAIGTLLLGGLSAAAQSNQLADQLYRQLSKAEHTLSFRFNPSVLDNINFDLDWQEYTQMAEGHINQVSLVLFSETTAGKVKLGRVAVGLENHGYQLLKLGDELAQNPGLQIFGKKVKGVYPEIFLLVTDNEDEGAIFMALTGELSTQIADL